MVSMLRSISEIFGSRKAVEVKKTSNELKKEGSDIKFAIGIADKVSSGIDSLLKLHSPQDQTCNSKEEFKEYIKCLLYLVSIKDKLNEAEKANPSVKDFAIIKFCRSIAENKELNDFAGKCMDIGYNTEFKDLYSQLNEIVENLNKDKLKEKISFLKKLKEKSDFNAIRNGYSNAWDFDDLLRDLMGDKNFKEEYMDKALDEEGESFSKSFKKDLNEYIELANHGEAAARKCLGEEVGLQTYYTQINDTDRALNINIISRDKTEPTKISDLLQKEENTSELNIYYKKKHEVHAYRDEKKRRHYEFKEGASYEMTSTWPVNCTMVMNVDSSGIAKIVEFNGRKSEFLSEHDLELVKQNHELYIQGCSLYNGVKKWLGPKCTESVRVIEPEKSKKKGTVTVSSAVPVVTGNNLQEDKEIEVKQDLNDKGIDANQDFENGTIAVEVKQNPNDKGIDANQDFESSAIAVEVKQDPNDKGTDTSLDFESSTIAVVCDTLASEVTKTSKTEMAIQTEIGSQQIATQTEVNSQQTGTQTQTEISTQQIAIQTEIGSQQIATQTEVNSQQTGTQTQTEISTQHIAVQTEIGLLQIATQTEVNSQQTGTQTQTEINTQQIATQTEVDSQQINKLILDNQRLSEENVELKQSVEVDLQVMNQKHHELMQEKQLLLEELKITKVEKEELSQKFLKTIELDERIKHVNELLKDKVEELNGEKCDLKDKIKKIEREFAEEKGFLNQRIADAQQKVVELSRRDSDLRCEIAEARQIIERLEQQNSDLQVRGKSENQVIESLEEQNGNLQIEKNKMREELVQSKKEHEEKAKELDSMYEKKRKAERELGALNKENSQLKDKVKILEKDVSTAEEETLRIANERDKIEENFRCHMLKDIEAIEKLEEQNSTLKAKNDKACEELAKLKKEQKEGTKELEGACEEKENVEKKLGVLSQQNVALNSMVKKLTEDLTKADEYAEYLMDEGNKAKQGFRSQMLELEQSCKEQLKSSAKGIEEQEWKLKELQNELERKKETFQKAERAYRELEAELKLEKMNNSFLVGTSEGAAGIIEGLKNKIEKLKEKIEKLEDTITSQERKNEDLTKQNEDSTKEIESLKRQIKVFVEDNTTDAAGIKHLIKTNPENYKLTQGVENITLPTQLSRPPSSDSYDGALGSERVYSLNRINPKKIFNSTDTQKINKISKDHKYAFDVLAKATREVVEYASRKKQPLSKSSSSSSVDSGFDSDKENCDNRSSGLSGFGPISSKILIERAARSASSSPNVVAVKS